jgi:shikimate kinase
MAAGKSTLGAMLALLMGLPFKDLDREIEEATGQRISDLFSKGEPHFRSIEKKQFHEILDSGFQGVLALGAGLPVQAGMVPELEQRGHCLFLDPDFDLLIQRIDRQEEDDPSFRPLAARLRDETEEARIQRLHCHWEERRLVYRSLGMPISVCEEDAIPDVLDRLLDAVSLSTKRGNR